jgi:hypothetical protein
MVWTSGGQHLFQTAALFGLAGACSPPSKSDGTPGHTPGAVTAVTDPATPRIESIRGSSYSAPLTSPGFS